MGYLDSQRHFISEALKKAGFAIRDFKWERGEDNVRVLRHRTLPFSMRFGVSTGGRWQLTYSPGEQTEQESNMWDNWTQVQLQVTKWVGYMKREVENPDPWAELDGESSDDDQQFTPTEVNRLAAAVDRIEEHLSEQYQLTQEMREELSELRETAKTATRGEWKSLFATVMRGIFLHFTMHPDQVRAVWGFAMTHLAPVFAHAPLALPPGVIGV